MSGVYCLSTTVEITFILAKLYLKKLIKKLLNFPNSIFCSMWKTEQRFVIFFFFHLSFPKVFYKSVLLSIIKVPYKGVLLSIITCRHLSLTYHTQKYFIEVRRWGGPVGRAGTPKWHDFYPTFIWNLLSQFNQKVCYVDWRLFDQVVFTINSDVKPSCRTNVLILFNYHLKNKTKLIKENSIQHCRAGSLARVHMDNFHLT